MSHPSPLFTLCFANVDRAPVMSGQCLSSSSLPGSSDPCPLCPQERTRTRISVLTVQGAARARPPRPPRVAVAPRGPESEEGLPLSLERCPGAPWPGGPCSRPAHVPGGRNVTPHLPHLVPGAAAPAALQRVPETLGSEGMWEQGAGGRWGAERGAWAQDQLLRFPASC